MSHPSHPNLRSPIDFPYEDIQYLHALAQDYLELMGESEPTQPNTLLTEYSTETPQQNQLIADNT